MVRRLALGLAFVLACAAAPARADILVVMNDSLIATGTQGGAQKALASLWDLASKGIAPGVHMNFAGSDQFTLAELRDSVTISSPNPRFKAHLMIVVGADRNQVVINPSKAGRLALSQLSKLANRPRVPILFVNVGDDASFQSGGNCSLGVVGAQIDFPGSALKPLAYSPAGYQFPINSLGWVKGAGGALPATGDYVTPVLSLGCYNYTKSNPNGVGGINSHPGTQSDTLFAWFYNPPNSTTYTDRTTAGFGVIQYGSASANAGGAQFPEGSLAAVAVGMMARLAPTQFLFPAVRTALEVDDGCKRFGGQASAPQMRDAEGGYDSLGVAKIPFTLGIEVDSMTVAESGSTRFALEFAAARRYGMGKVTVHNHRGVSVADSTLGASQGSASGAAYADIFGSFVSRYCFGTSAGTRDKSVYSLLKGATAALVSAAGGRQYVSFSVMPPGDNYRTILASTSGGNAATYDSIAYAIALAGYRVVRTQYLAATYNYQMGGGTGGMPRGGLYPLPNARVIGAALSPAVTDAPRGLLFAGSGYVYGTTTDTSNAGLDHGALRVNMNTRLSAALGFARPIDMTAAQEATAGVANGVAFHGTAREAIWVTHVPNWRHNLSEAVATNPYGTQRPAWTSVRMIHAVMMAARWATCATGNCAGPVEWHWSDEVTERDIR